MVRSNLVVAMALLVLLPAMSSSAQTEPPPDASRLRMRIGPLTINPRIGLTNLGFDQNVFNEPQIYYRSIADQWETFLMQGTTITGGIEGRF